jgi:transcriptional regulator with GAF, ATPase, and Fis domain
MKKKANLPVADPLPSHPVFGMVGSGAEMQKIFRLVEQVAPSDSTVLLLGETGTGKELIARAIHDASSRKDQTMIKVNCAALPANLIESELFGHEKGSFTGAIERRIGKFELASNSTLFLDEIGELPLELQVKLLRALQEKEIERIGGRGSIKVNTRIIAATNRNLLTEVQEGRFRADLYYRLDVFPITLPPLRHRMEDIPVLTTHFISRYASSAGKKITTLSHKVLDDLMTYSWPGNVRELEHLVERSVLLTNGDTILKMTLPSSVPHPLPTPIIDEFHIRPLEEVERDYILQAIKKCNGRVSGPHGAAIRLGLPSTTLISKMQKLGIKKIIR